MKKTHPRRKPQIPLEEQVKHLKKILRKLIALIFVLILLLGAAGYFAVIHLLESDITFLPGQNYSSVVEQEASETE